MMPDTAGLAHTRSGNDDLWFLVKVNCLPIEIRASIKKLIGLSGHADKNGLIDWLSGFEKKPERVFVVHGEESVCEAFKDCLNNEYGYHAYAPYSGTRFNLASNEVEYAAVPVRVEKKKTKGASEVFRRLLAAGQRSACPDRPISFLMDARISMGSPKSFTSEAPSTICLPNVPAA